MTLVGDSSVLIDLVIGELEERLFRLGDAVMTTDLLYRKELAARHGHLPQLGLEIIELDQHLLNAAARRLSTFLGTNIYDQSVLALAEREGATLLTGDGPLRAAARQEGVRVQGTIWVVERLVAETGLQLDAALVAYDRMEDDGSRIPFDLARARIERLQAGQAIGDDGDV